MMVALHREQSGSCVGRYRRMENWIEIDSLHCEWTLFRLIYYMCTICPYKMPNAAWKMCGQKLASEQIQWGNRNWVLCQLSYEKFIAVNCPLFPRTVRPLVGPEACHFYEPTYVLVFCLLTSLLTWWRLERIDKLDEISSFILPVIGLQGDSVVH